MAEFTEEIRLMIIETRTDVALIKQAIKGDGGKGLFQRMDEQELKTTNLESRHNKLGTRLTILISFLAGSGILGGTGYGIISLLR